MPFRKLKPDGLGELSMIVKFDEFGCVDLWNTKIFVGDGDIDNGARLVVEPLMLEVESEDDDTLFTGTVAELAEALKRLKRFEALFSNVKGKL